MRVPGCAVAGCAPAGTMEVLALRVLAEPMVVPDQRTVASGFMFARRVLAESRVVCVRRKSNPRCDPGKYFSVWYGRAVPWVDLDVQSRVVSLP